MDIKLLNDYFYSTFNIADPDDCLYKYGTGSLALLYSVLFLPELIVVDDSVLLRKNLKEKVDLKRFLEAKQNGIMSIQVLEASFNFIEVGYLFNTEGRDTSDSDDLILAYRIRDAWQGWLNFNFPERKFIIEVLKPEETGSTVGVHFYENRDQTSQGSKYKKSDTL